MESTFMFSTMVKVFSVHLSNIHKWHSHKLLGYLVTETIMCSTVKYCPPILLPHTSISLVHCLNSLWSSWCLVLVDPKLRRFTECKLLPSWTVRAPLIPLIFFGTKSNQTNTNKLKNQLKITFKHRVKARTLLAWKPTVGFQLGKLTSQTWRTETAITWWLLWWKFLTVVPNLISFRLYMRLYLILGYDGNDLDFEIKLWFYSQKYKTTTSLDMVLKFLNKKYSRTLLIWTWSLNLLSLSSNLLW